MPHKDILDNFDFDDHLYLDGDNQGEVVARFYSLMEAEVAAARLRSEGVPCFLANIVSMTMTPHLQPLVRLHVRPADLETARAILAEAALDYEPETEARPVGWLEIVLVVLVLGSCLILVAVWARL